MAFHKYKNSKASEAGLSDLRSNSLAQKNSYAVLAQQRDAIMQEEEETEKNRAKEEENAERIINRMNILSSRSKSAPPRFRSRRRSRGRASRRNRGRTNRRNRGRGKR